MLKNLLRAMGVYVAVFLTFHYGQAQIPNQRPETTPARRIGNPWAKDGFDVRDFGVDCTFARDSSAALNAIYANEATMLLPFLEQIRCLVSTRTIANYFTVLRGVAACYQSWPEPLLDSGRRTWFHL